MGELGVAAGIAAATAVADWITGGLLRSVLHLVAPIVAPFVPASVAYINSQMSHFPILNSGPIFVVRLALGVASVAFAAETIVTALGLTIGSLPAGAVFLAMVGMYFLGKYIARKRS